MNEERQEQTLCFRLIESLRKRLKNGRDQHLLSGLGGSASYRESKKMTEQRQGPTLGVRLRDALALQSVKENGWRTAGTNSRCPFKRRIGLTECQRKWLKNGREQLLVSSLGRCPSCRESKKWLTNSRHFREVCVSFKEQKQGQTLDKEVVYLVKVFIKRKVSVIRHISSSLTSL